MCAQPRQQVNEVILALLQATAGTDRPVLVLLKPITQRLTEPKYSTVNYHLILVTSVTGDVVHGMHFNKEVDIPTF